MKHSPPALADDDTDESSVQRIIPAHTAARPTTSAANSVFDAGRKAKIAARPPTFDLAAVVIRHNWPKPPGRGALARSYRHLISRMAPGDSVELPLRQAYGLLAQSKRDAKRDEAAPQLSFRKITATTASIWRDT